MKTVAVIVLLALSLLWVLRDRQHSQPTPQDVPAAAKAAPAPLADKSDSAVAQPPPEVSEQRPLKQRVRELVSNAETQSPGELEAAVNRLSQDILAREAQGDLLPGESAYLQLTLLEALPLSADERKQRAAALLESYEAASQQGWDQFNARQDETLNAYRQAEAELVRAAREQGMSAQALREQLQALRVQHFSNAATADTADVVEQLQ